MNFVRITYTGRKLYRDRATGHVWTPGEEKLGKVRLLPQSDLIQVHASSSRRVQTMAVIQVNSPAKTAPQNRARTVRRNR